MKDVKQTNKNHVTDRNTFGVHKGSILFTVFKKQCFYLVVTQRCLAAL